MNNSTDTTTVVFNFNLTDDDDFNLNAPSGETVGWTHETLTVKLPIGTKISYSLVKNATSFEMVPLVVAPGRSFVSDWGIRVEGAREYLDHIDMEAAERVEDVRVAANLYGLSGDLYPDGYAESPDQAAMDYMIDQASELAFELAGGE